MVQHMEKIVDGKPFPLVVNPTSKEWIQENQSLLKTQLLEHGAILFRGHVKSVEEFYALTQTLRVSPLSYVGGAAPRNTVYKDIHTTNESPPDQPIPFHHEMSQVPIYPNCLFFYCDVPPSIGGETPILPSWKVYEAVSKKYPEFISELESKGVIYTRIIPQEDDPSSPIGRGWINTFGTSDKVKAQEAAKNLNVQLEWLPNGDVKTISPILDAIKTYQPDYPSSPSKKVWFNSLVAAYLGWKDCRNDPSKAVIFGDGSPMNPDIIHDITNIMNELCVAFEWEQGDVLWIDNHQTMHSRNPFEKPRRILAFLGKEFF